MALEYDSDDIGELDDDAEDMMQGPATVQQFDNLLTEFLEDHPTQDHNHEAGYAYHAAGGSVAGGPVDQAAVAKVNNSKPAYNQDAMERHKLQATYVQDQTSMHATEMLCRTYSILCRVQTPARDRIRCFCIVIAVFVIQKQHVLYSFYLAPSARRMCSIASSCLL